MKSILLGCAAAALLAMPAAAGGGGAGEMQGLTDGMEAKIQTRVLDAMLGRGAAFAFLEMKAELTSAQEEQSRSGTGEVRTELPAESAEKNAKKKQGQTAVQAKGSSERKTVLGLVPVTMKLRVLHDAALPQEKLKAVREALAELFRGELKPEDLVFVPAVLEKRPG